MSTMDAAVYAKIKAMQGKRLNENDYQELLRCRSVGEIAAYLKHSTGYAEVLSDINENTIHRGQLEQLLHRALLDEYERIIHFTDSAADEYFAYFIVKNEIEQLLSFIRYLHSGMPSQYALDLPSYLVGKLTIDFFAVARCRNLCELAELLKHTRYERVLQTICETSENYNFSIVGVETVFITFYFNEVLRMLDNSVTGKENDELRGFFLQRAEMYNLVTAFRAKEFFNLSADHIKPLMLPFRAKLAPTFMDSFLQKDRDQMREMLQNSSYAWLLENYEFETVDELRTVLEYELCRRYMRVSFEGGSVFIAHIGLRENELKNIIHIIEGVRYGMKPDQIEKLLVGHKAS